MMECSKKNIKFQRIWYFFFSFIFNSWNMSQLTTSHPRWLQKEKVFKLIFWQYDRAEQQQRETKKIGAKTWRKFENKFQIYFICRIWGIKRAHEMKKEPEHRFFSHFVFFLNIKSRLFNWNEIQCFFFHKAFMQKIIRFRKTRNIFIAHYHNKLKNFRNEIYNVIT